MPVWEYWVEALSISDRWTAKAMQGEIATLVARLNSAGGRQWELVNVATVPLTGAWSNNIKGYAHLAFFKRPVGQSP